jgi:hypothetical protein
MAEIEGIKRVLTGASDKYIIDLILDTIVYELGLKIHHIPVTSNSHKIRLAERHFSFVEQYAKQRHISLTLAANLILNDYFSSRIGTNYATKEEQNTPSLSKSNSNLHKNNEFGTDNSSMAQNTPSVRGIGLLQNLKQ